VYVLTHACRLITIGGADNSVFQWRFYPEGGQAPADLPSDDEDVSSR
jgi:hypothetical protein